MTCPLPPWVVPIILALAVGLGLEAPRTAQEAPGRPIPTQAAPTPSPKPTSRPGPSYSVTGTATWYRYVQGQAAAGPGLRGSLGPSWRGRIVTVTAGDVAIRVRLTDWCGCPGGRVVDLDRRDFARLASPSRGVVKVVVKWDD